MTFTSLDTESKVEKKSLDDLHQCWKTVNKSPLFGQSPANESPPFDHDYLTEPQQIIDQINSSLDIATSETIVRAGITRSQIDTRIDIHGMNFDFL